MIELQKGKLAALLATVVITGVLAGFASGYMIYSPRSPEVKTFTAIAHHWGFAFYNSGGEEITMIQVAKGDVVELTVISGGALSMQIHHEFAEKTGKRNWRLSCRQRDNT